MSYTVETTSIGDGHTKLFGFSFKVALADSVNVEVDGTAVPFTVSGSSVELAVAPAAGAVVRIYRLTNLDALRYQYQLGAPFLPSTVDANNIQMLYALQESNTISRDAAATAADASTRADHATTTANSALAASGTAMSQSSIALSTANSAAAEASQAATDAAAAESSASAAQLAASAAQTTATAAQTAASTALTTAQTADTKATQATADASAALSTAGAANSTANAASDTAGTAMSTANTAAADASTALSTANGIDAKATQALSTANAASAKADEAMAAVSESGVASWNGRSGIVTPQSGDYTAAQVSRGASNVDADLTALETGKASTVHAHVISDVTGLQTALSGKAPAAHGHAIADVTGLQTALDGKASTVHGHAISNVTGLQTALDGKQNYSALLTALAALQTAADQLIYATASNKFAMAALTPLARQLLSCTDQAGLRSVVGAIGSVDVPTVISWQPGGGYGTYAFAGSQGVGASLGQTVEGSKLYPCSTTAFNTAAPLAGTWRCMGHANGAGTLWMRIA